MYLKKNDYFINEDPELKNEIQWIIPNAQKNTMEPIRLTLSAGGSTYPDSPHEGEEFGYVLSGSILIHLGNRTYKAKKGESFYYTSDKTHYLESAPARRSSGSARRQVSNTTHYFTIYGGNP